MSKKRKMPTMPGNVPVRPGQAPARLNWVPILLAVAGTTVIIFGVTQLKAQNSPAPATTSVPGGTLPADQLDQALAQGQPVLVFMHSTNCRPCQQMMRVVDQVYPEFAGQVVLVDVNVYDDANVPLMQKLGLRMIPTTVIFDRQGQPWQHVGVMTPDDLRTQLRQRALGG